MLERLGVLIVYAKLNSMKVLLIHRTRCSTSCALKIIFGQNPLCLDFYANTMVFADRIPPQPSSIAILKIFGYIDCLFYRRHAPAKFHTNLSKKTTIRATSTE
jgi:hypothetical protein